MVEVSGMVCGDTTSFEAIDSIESARVPALCGDTGDCKTSLGDIVDADVRDAVCSLSKLLVVAGG